QDRQKKPKDSNRHFVIRQNKGEK
ncbi:DUF1027 domain-containing protein, partial [Leptospira interrogans]